MMRIRPAVAVVGVAVRCACGGFGGISTGPRATARPQLGPRLGSPRNRPAPIEAVRLAWLPRMLEPPDVVGRGWGRRQRGAAQRISVQTRGDSRRRRRDGDSQPRIKLARLLLLPPEAPHRSAAADAFITCRQRAARTAHGSRERVSPKVGARVVAFACSNTARQATAASLSTPHRQCRHWKPTVGPPSATRGSGSRCRCVWRGVLRATPRSCRWRRHRAV